MPGISQVWLTAEELEAIAVAFDALDVLAGREGGRRAKGALAHPKSREAREKIETALGPVACKVASG